MANAIMAARGGPLRALVVEDSPISREVLCLLLQVRLPRFELLEAGDVASARRLAREKDPLLAVVDIGLPDGSGLDLAAELKQERPGCVVALCTTYDLPEYREAAARCGIDHFVSKEAIFSETAWDPVILSVTRES